MWTLPSVWTHSAQPTADACKGLQWAKPNPQPQNTPPAGCRCLGSQSDCSTDLPGDVWGCLTHRFCGT